MVELNIAIWLKPEDLEGETEVEFIDEGKLELISLPNGESREVFEIGIKLPNGEERRWTMNATSMRVVASKYGRDTTNWLNKKTIVYAVQQNVRGEMKNVIYAK